MIHVSQRHVTLSCPKIHQFFNDVYKKHLTLFVGISLPLTYICFSKLHQFKLFEHFTIVFQWHLTTTFQIICRHIIEYYHVSRRHITLSFPKTHYFFSGIYQKHFRSFIRPIIEFDLYMFLKDTSVQVTQKFTSFSTMFVKNISNYSSAYH